MARKPFKPTQEQEAAIDAMRTGQNIVLTAGAGTGKTETLRQMALAMPGRGIYVAYNREIREEAKKRFPRAVDCRTSSSLAFRDLGWRFKARLDGPRQSARDVARILGVRSGLWFDSATALTATQIARIAVATVERYCMSDELEIQPWHVPKQTGVTEQAWVEQLRATVLPYARRAWENLQIDDQHGRFSPDDADTYRDWIRFTHDHYTKLWALTGPQLRADYILFDEAQDANPVLSSVLQAQVNAQLIAVGDSCQQLYGWRGAVDALAKWPAEVRLKLSESFRFGAEIAHEANKWLHVLNAELRLVGRGAGGLVGPIDDWPDAVLCRTNAAAMSHAMDALAAGKRTAMAGGGAKMRWLAEAAEQLKAGRGTSHPELCVFKTWGEVQAYCESDATAGDLRVFVRLIDEYGPKQIVRALDQLVPEKRSKLDGASWQPPEVVVSTGHKAKGLQWGRVRISDDFREPGTDDNGRPRRVSKADAMLAYVAVTRAQRHLDREGVRWIDRRPELAGMAGSPGSPRAR